jgi:flagellar basal body-associated protein FliL
MTRTTKSRLISLLIFILTFAMLVCSFSVTVFAHDGEDHDHEEESNTGSTTTKKETVWEKIGKWFDSKVGQIVGYCVAGVIFVACVAFIIWWIPKKNEGKEKKTAKK